VFKRIDIIAASRKARVHTETIRRAIRLGEIPYERERRSGKLFFDPRDIAAFAASRSRVERHSQDPDRRILGSLAHLERLLARTAKGDL
jgi:hypothetical protein